MDLQRQEYPAMLATLQPSQAVTILLDRVKHVGKINSEIADWLQERRRIEEAYAQGLRKLARRPSPDESSDLGIFSQPWHRIISSTEAIADSHHTLATRIETDVERPLRDYERTNREMQAMSTISGNLAAMAKDIDSANKKADKLKEKGPKAAAGKVANATSDLDNATSQWESQAPYVFEQLQAVDESRCNFLRDVLTQFETHEVDQVERSRITAEQCLNSLLNIETADEIKTFALKTTEGRIPVQRPKGTPTPSRSLPPSTPTINTDDGSSQRSGSEQRHGGLHGLKRLGTVLGRRRQSVHPYGRGSSPERKSSSNLASSFGAFGRSAGKSKDLPPPQESPQASPSRQLSETRATPSSPRQSDSTSSPKQKRRSIDHINGTLANSAEPGSSSGVINGEKAPELPVPSLLEPLQPTKPSSANNDLPKDAEGFSIPPSGSDAISQAEQEAVASESNAPQFKLDIRNAPIAEEDADAETALANVAYTLRAQAAQAPARKGGTVRGRRDVRNTIFVPSPQPSDIQLANDAVLPPVIQSTTQIATNVPLPTSPPTVVPPGSPFKVIHRSSLLGDEPTASDTQSVRSGRSLSSSTSITIKHPELHSPGLNSSVVETVSTTFTKGKITKAIAIGELALAYNPQDLLTPFGTESIRLENFPVLEKVAPNPVFVEQVADKSGVYSVNLSSIAAKTVVAFKYQLHLDESNLANYSPLLLTPVYKIEPAQTSAILSYALNPAFNLGNRTSVTLSNVILILHLDAASTKPISCQSKPVGSFSKEKMLIYWRVGDVTLTPDGTTQQLRARFFTEGEAKPANVEARWEIMGENASELGSGLSVSIMVPREEEGRKVEEEVDPFADEGERDKEPTPAPNNTWKEIAGVRKIRSGAYTAI
ncbi:hypothetical protein M501DRAFT_941406 [Patellaria atrata CBS 101060]|uniref:MHD domain-containing protein n=1 Tax=Patellaria atrata CBS 101060 TaxID=1346257 RepID=A0A9P4S500_9PEZI|nr:hypothetical protein M501DRAFT_941406 [Patellaria atrata CBS 101060]